MMSPRAFLSTSTPSHSLRFPEHHEEATASSTQRNVQHQQNKSTQHAAAAHSDGHIPSTRHSQPSSFTAAIAMSRTMTTCMTEPRVIPRRTSRPPCLSGAHDGSSNADERFNMSTRQNHRSARKLPPLTPSPSPRSRSTASIHSPDALSPSMAALLAMTSIPLPRQKSISRVLPPSAQRLTVDAIEQHARISTKELPSSISANFLDFLLGEDEDDAGTIDSDPGQHSFFSSRTMSFDSIPSLEDESPGDSSVSLPSLLTPDSYRRRRSSARRSRTLSSPPRQEIAEHPLSDSLDVSELDFGVFAARSTDALITTPPATPTPQRRSVFKSNLTASLKALRSAALSLSSIAGSPMLTPDDFLTRSIISIDPAVPFTDERMPPRLSEIPTPELRRYLNPTTNAPISAHVPASQAQTTQTLQPEYKASIQLRPWGAKSRSSSSSSPPSATSSTSGRGAGAGAPCAAAKSTTSSVSIIDSVALPSPLAKQRDYRENSDFIRVAVMEMAMRKAGKLDDKSKGRAQWALPPRIPSVRPYQLDDRGVPIRWVGVSAE